MWEKNTRFYVDFLYGYGLREGFANLGKLPDYYPVNLGVEHVFHTKWGAIPQVKLRFDCINVFDEVYQLRNGTGLGIAASQYGHRRMFFAGLSVASEMEGTVMNAFDATRTGLGSESKPSSGFGPSRRCDQLPLGIRAGPGWLYAPGPTPTDGWLGPTPFRSSSSWLES